MPWNSLQFVQQLDQCGNRYEMENRWFSKQAWGDQHRYALAAGRLYRCAATSPLGMLLLGSAKIRKDPALLGNFGITSAGGLREPDDLKLLDELERRRATARTAPGLRDAPAVLGSGSILNDQDWTPLLNDAFILGGVHARHEFHLAEDDVNQYFGFLERRATFERNPRTLDATEKWAVFFRAHPEILWMRQPGVPRILARELIGLKTFGYRPQFSLQQLSFRVEESGKASNAGLRSYLDAVEAAGFRSGSAKSVLETISQFLFGRADVFRGV